jgi:hypothetical protein
LSRNVAAKGDDSFDDISKARQWLALYTHLIDNSSRHFKDESMDLFCDSPEPILTGVKKAFKACSF